MPGDFSADQIAKEVAVLYMLPGDHACQFHDEKVGYHDEMVVPCPQGAAEVVMVGPNDRARAGCDLLGFHPLRQLIHGYLQAKLLGLVTAPASSTPTEMGYLDELVLLRPQGTTEVVVLAADFDNTRISSPASAQLMAEIFSTGSIGPLSGGRYYLDFIPYVSSYAEIFSADNYKA